MAGHRLFFFPFRDTPTLIWIKEKEGIFCTRGASSRLPVGRHGSGCQKFNDAESDFAAGRNAGAPSAV
jgi:hypothetical protein